MPTEESASQEVTSQEQTEKSPSVSITETAEFKAELVRLAQSEADKRVKVFEEKIRSRDAELARLREEHEAEKKALIESREEAETNTFLNKFVQSGELSETNLPPIQDFAKKIYARDRQSRQEEARIKQEKQKIEEEARAISDDRAMLSVLKMASEQGVNLSFADALSIGKESEGNAKLMEYMIKAKAVTTVPTESPKPKRPGTPGTTASGAGDEASIRKRYRDNPDDPKAKEDYLRWRREKGI